ncbi:1-acyl-sn-glycerol-3-phosphate acyltransferase [Candidatus Terasakiella magnetica]|uniref:1-acyl-sn-glycerol-3-phosphate acyltransferase n=1 Tax=Candidatus Terasakiella magnetica TaxID=1867952 RepID=A0A1C3RIP2_9PROT|nr:lysophospholipid acyltransferase family protein [Candidatus Terasakiella magnetica]SCA57132.1 1-acyl-sn-glycerol-3-phosphate acyltransferase [Candidatus Terasakiella magnetica]
MTFIRSLLFNIYLFGGTALIALVLLILMPFSSQEMRKGSQFWTRYVMWGMRNITGITYEVRGIEHLPQSGAIVACKHQSAWDTAIFVLLRISTAYILKQELLKIPFYGWYVKRSGHIAVDRNAGASALKNMVSDVRNALEKERNVVIFPEGTRSSPGEPGTYHPGIAAIYTQTKLPVIPVALNSGLHWGRRSFLKKPGKIIMEIMPPIEAGMKRRDFMAKLEETIETKTRELEAEGQKAGE